MCEQTVLDFKWMDVFAAADDEIFDASCDGDVPFRVHGCFVAGMHPYLAFVVGYHDFSGLLRLAPVLFHHEVAVDCELASFADREDF